MTDRNFTKAEAIALIKGSQRKSDDFVDATALCKKFGKDWRDFQKDEQRRKYVAAVGFKLNVPLKDIIETKRGKGGGTRVHPLVAIEVARWLSPELSVAANEVFQGYLEGNADLGLDIMLRDHNHARLDRAKHRLRVVDANKQAAALAVKNGVRPDQVHNDRYRGLYQQTASQLRSAAQASGLPDLRNDETPLNVLSTYDLAVNELANLMALRSNNSNATFSCANSLRQVHEQETGLPLVPEWEDNRMQPAKARRLINTPQLELPV
jgi:KilA-N domain